MTATCAKGSVSTQLETRQELSLGAEIRAHAFCSMTRNQISAARRKPGNPPAGWPTFQPTILRNADDQTVVALAAVYGTLRQLEYDDPHYLENWGILVASRFLGRSSLVIALQRYRSDGVWGVSPHLTPHYALHSPAGTLSIALGVHGPNLGVGGGPGTELEGMITALTWLEAGIAPGLWLVFSGWTPEFVPDQDGEPSAHCECQALALALARSTAARTDRPRLRVLSGEPAVPCQTLDLALLDSLLDQNSEVDRPSARSATTGLCTAAISARRSPLPISPCELRLLPRAAQSPATLQGG